MFSPPTIRYDIMAKPDLSPPSSARPAWGQRLVEAFTSGTRRREAATAERVLGCRTSRRTSCRSVLEVHRGLLRIEVMLVQARGEARRAIDLMLKQIGLLDVEVDTAPIRFVTLTAENV